MSNKADMIIVGAGIAGLAAGCYARMNGYDVQVFEMHDKPGGMCTSWQRKGYSFDYCIHNLVGTAPRSGFRQVWDELGALDGVDIIDHQEFVTVEGPAGEHFHWFTDLDRLEEHLQEIAPADADVIRDLLGGARRFASVDLFSMPLGGRRRTLRVIPVLPAIKRWSEITMGQFAERFKDPFMRRAWLHAQYDIPGAEVPMTAPLLFMSGLHKGDLGWPTGGSLAFSKRIEQRLRDLGGEVQYRSPVEKILVENARAVGVRLSDGTEHRAARIVSAADGATTIYKMLDGRYLTEWIEKYYSDPAESGPFGLFVFLGIDAELTGQPHALTLLLDEEIDLGEIQQDSLHITMFGPETGLAPEGKSIVKIETQASHPYWKSMREEDLAAYRERKQEIAGRIIDLIAPKFPGLKEQIEVVDVCTPPTAERFTGNRHGWQAGPPKENATVIQSKGLSHTLPGLDGFHHVGQWSNATMGVSSVAVTGRNLVKALCREDGRSFKTG